MGDTTSTQNNDTQNTNFPANTRSRITQKQSKKTCQRVSGQYRSCQVVSAYRRIDVPGSAGSGNRNVCRVQSAENEQQAKVAVQSGNDTVPLAGIEGGQGSYQGLVRWGGGERWLDQFGGLVVRKCPRGFRATGQSPIRLVAPLHKSGHRVP